MKMQQFPISYGAFCSEVSFEQNGTLLKMGLAHRVKIQLILTDEDREIIPVWVSMIEARTPSTYYSGNRRYGKFLFLYDDDELDEIVVKQKEYSSADGSNAGANQENSSILRLPAHGGGSIGFSFFQKKRSHGTGGAFFEELIELKLFKVEWVFPLLTDAEFVQAAMPANLTEAIYGAPEIVDGFPCHKEYFPHQTSGWRRNEDETHLFAITAIRGVNCFIPFAAASRDIWGTLPEGVEYRYLKCLVPSPETGEERPRRCGENPPEAEEG